MLSIKDVSVAALQAGSRYIRPLTLHYTQNGVARRWDLMRVHDSVAVLVYNATRDVFVFVRQFRPAVFYSQLPEAACIDPSRLDINRQLTSVTSQQPADPGVTSQQSAEPGVTSKQSAEPVVTSQQSAEPGVTLELCAGCVDKDLPLVEIAREELLEECGYNVTSQRLQPIKSFVGSVGTAGSKMTMFYVNVTDQDKVSQGGGNTEEGESVQVVEMSVDEVRAYLGRPHVLSPPVFLFAIYWFFMHVLRQPV